MVTAHRPQSSGTMVRFSPDALSVEKTVQKGELLCSRILPEHKMRMNTGPEAGQPMVTARNGGGQRGTAVTRGIKGLNF